MGDESPKQTIHVAEDEGSEAKITIDTRNPSLIKPPTGFSDTLTYRDGGFSAWLVTFASFLTLFTCVGLQYCAGTYIRYFYFQATFSYTSFSTISFISSMNGAAFPLFAPLVGDFVERKGPRIGTLIGGLIQSASYVIASFSPHVGFSIAFQGLMFGIGEVFVYMSAVNIITQYFNKLRGLALGFAVAGSGAGGLAMAVITQALLDGLGWQWALRIEAVMMLATCLFGAAMFNSVQPRNPRRLSILASAKFYFQDSRFVVLWASGLLSFFGFFLPFSYLPSYATSQGIDANRASLILGLTNGGSAVGRIFLGYLADKTGYLNIYVITQIACPIICLFWPLAKSFGGLLVLGMCYGFFAGGFVSSQPPMLASVFGGDNLTARLGIVMSSTLAGNVGGAPIAGAILDAHTTVDADGNKTIDFVPMIMFGGLTMLAGNLLLVWVWGKTTRWKLKRI
ncbi:MFS general substrate transporter [Gonapodya prolifera JEL478]|uniref:MFS general substrate transporter n=1 Tax=Gonapodya prolifera (strain JEL478) TaxID=1344416 RepID=A0A139ATK0_GONPJ|nr:MFS general substrate transporter [Gonapodya prolifera JEL478]|eukprot:KXS20051.1 MFS general substrate transporter [Gonapodya prolifera JEL478]